MPTTTIEQHWCLVNPAVTPRSVARLIVSSSIHNPPTKDRGNEKATALVGIFSEGRKSAARGPTGKPGHPYRNKRGCVTAACKAPDSAVDSAQASDTIDLSPGQTSPRHPITIPASYPAGSCVIGERQCPIQEDAHVRASDTHHTIRP
jgi:hypothetical protein